MSSGLSQRELALLAGGVAFGAALVLAGRSSNGTKQAAPKITDQLQVIRKSFRNLDELMARGADDHDNDSDDEPLSSDTRTEADLIGSMQVPNKMYYGVQTLRAVQNYQVTGVRISHFPGFVHGLALTKKACCQANNKLGLIPNDKAKAINDACDDLMNPKKRKLHKYFVVDLIQGGAGTSTNMNANEVIANLALEKLGKKKGEYTVIHPNDDINRGQSTNDAYPTACKLAILLNYGAMVDEMKALVKSFNAKAEEFKSCIKMGRTQLQDAVPMTVGQEFHSWATTVESDIAAVENVAKYFLDINLGGTAIGTGICADPKFGKLATDCLSKLTGMNFKLGDDLIYASSSVSAMITFSGILKRVAIKISKICNDLRLLASGPRCGIRELNLPEMAPGSSIMPGKVNPVIPEMMNQIAFQVIGNDLTVTMAGEAGQLQLNVMEPVIVFALFQNMDMLTKGFRTLRKKCIDGITVNEKHCKDMVDNSVGIVTALLPVIGYKKSTICAKKAIHENRSVVDVVVAEGFLSREKVSQLLRPEKLTTNLPSDPDLASRDRINSDY